MFSEDIVSNQEVEESESVEEGSVVEEEEVAEPSGICRGNKLTEQGRIWAFLGSSTRGVYASSITTSSQEVEESESESIDSTEASELKTEEEEIVAGTSGTSTEK